jgi:hypothetical protein
MQKEIGMLRLTYYRHAVGSAAICRIIKRSMDEGWNIQFKIEGNPTTYQLTPSPNPEDDQYDGTLFGGLPPIQKYYLGNTVTEISIPAT